MQYPIRPQAPEISDYDDGDPYSCMAAGFAEHKQQEALKKQVESCLFDSEDTLLSLFKTSPAGVKTALYDIWHQFRKISARQDKAERAARLLADFGEPAVLEYHRAKEKS